MYSNENDLLVRCSELSKIMTKSRTKSNPLSDTTMTYVRQKAKEFYFNYRTEIKSKYLEKGIRNEDTAIKMLSDVYFNNYTKNEVRNNNGWLTGECDIITSNLIIDIKCSWNLDTFPAFLEEAVKGVIKSGYDWQLRGYMLLYNINFSKVAYCLTNTPEDLLGYGDEAKNHNFDHLDKTDKITIVDIERDKDLEIQIKEQYDKANAYYKKCLAELKTKNK